MDTEFNFDGLVGPTHNYAGLSHGNIASTRHQHAVSSPKSAALQGLAKMKFVRDLGIPQCVLPPLPRPNLAFLRQLGFSGKPAELIDQAYRTDPVLLAICYSASNMWTANAATVSPSIDCVDGRLHFTPANLACNVHRSLEASATTNVLRQIFSNQDRFNVHDPLPSNMAYTDEGAANHTRLAPAGNVAGLELFVYGCEFLNMAKPRPSKFPARQTREASEAICRRHQLRSTHTVLAQQNPQAIDAGVFHNDVISVGHQNVLLCHEWAFLDQPDVVLNIESKFKQLFGEDLFTIALSADELPIQDAVKSYLFNSQIVTRPNGKMAMVCPAECQENEWARRCTDRIREDQNPIDDIHFLDLRQSMNNGGGPACLRLRVVLNEREKTLMHDGVQLTDALYGQLVAWVERHYRDSLSADDLRDPKLIDEVAEATQQLEKILNLSLMEAHSIA